ncbi:HAD-IC family P-type ATPase [Breznakia pachnodae]|uniref:Cation-transporting ATPase E n=1 Tax=Breznakia pachnodae TaxID=265178 RepID=A0ABU0DYA2_9FIRM|nr:HAD-IC family P-type ATPase [Breznakia pachnodae]MDQ0359619.1 cation-transporting ATPase E [Breznakia pachnodae]
MVRYDPKLDHGLTNKQVEERKRDNLINASDINETKSYKKIITDNLFTLFNFVNLVLACIIIPTGSFKNLLFLGGVVSNFVIGTFQEIRAKRTLDRISLIVSLKAHVIREGEHLDIPVEEVVLDDLLEIKTGDQIVSDSVVLDGVVEVDESLLTGESDFIKKEVGDFLYSGSFVVSGCASTRADKVGNDNYAAKITRDAKKFQRYPSQLRDSLNAIIKGIGIMIIPLGGCLFFQSFVVNGNDYATSVLSVSAALIGMIPEGLVILTSIALAVGVMNLAKQKTLVQELYCLETLARVDTLCLDKTGTITEGLMEVKEVIKFSDDNIEEIMKNYLYITKPDNPTSLALYDYYDTSETFTFVSKIPFSSKRKYSTVSFSHASYVLGAYEFIVEENIHHKNDIEALNKQGYRVIALAKSSKQIGEKLPDDLEVIALFGLVDKIREDAKTTLSYFMEQDVCLKVISGDNPKAVSQIAKRAGVNNAEAFLDVHNLSDEQIDELIEDHTVFGRVSPQQKKLMVERLKEHGHIVAMTGDGVNDVLAFKAADISIAMASGSDVAKSSANLVLLDNNFDAMPHVLYEGRRVINNIEKVATLFLTKTIFSSILAFFVLFTNMSYPFVPIQLTMVSSLTIGIPGFILALEPNRERVKGEFLENVLKVSLPSAISAVISLIYCMLLYRFSDISREVMVQLAVLTLCFNGMIVLVKVARPFTPLRTALVVVMGIGLVGCLLFFYDFFGMKPLIGQRLILPMLIIVAILLGVSYIGRKIVEQIYKIKRKK